MKKLLLAGAALALIAGPAAAQSWGSQTYGQDAIAVWGLNAPVTTFCRLNANGGVQSGNINSNFVAGVNGTGGGTAAEADGTFTLNMQDPTTNTIRLVEGAVTYARSQCNTPFEITALSQNGGLRNNDQSTTDTNFTNDVDYVMDVKFGGGATSPLITLSGASQTLIPTQQATAGDFRIGIRVPANPNILLLRGTYRDRLTVTMRPFIS